MRHIQTMTIKDIIVEIDIRIKYRYEAYERESREMEREKLEHRIYELKDLKKWIKSNLEEEQAKYGKDYDDWKESKMAEKREG